jgi:hypothetical protein
MANLLFLIALTLFSSSSFAQFNTVRRSPVKVTQSPLVTQGQKLTGIELMALSLYKNMPRHILSTLFGRQDLTANEKKILKDIRALHAAHEDDISIVFSDDGALFDLPQYATHRLVVTGNKPGPIIFNRAYFSSMAKAPTVETLLGYLVHELGHQTGKGFEFEAELDRVSQKVAEHVKSQGGEIVEPSAGNFRLWTNNFLSVEAVKKVVFSEIENNNVGQLWFFDDSNILRLTDSIVAALPDWTMIHPSLKYTAYVGTGSPYFNGIREYSDYPLAQSVRGPLSLIVTNETGQYMEVRAQYEVLIPVTADGKYTGQPIITNINNVMGLDEMVVSAEAAYKVLRAEYVEAAPRRVEFELTCPAKPQVLGAWVIKELPNKPRAVDTDIEEFVELDFSKEANGRCFYKMDLAPTSITDPNLVFKIHGLKLLTAKKQLAVLPLPQPVKVQLTGKGVLPPMNHLKIENVQMYWAQPTGPNSWETKEVINLSSEIKADLLSGPRDIILIVDVEWGAHLYCGTTFTIGGKSRNFPSVKDVYISDFFPQERENLTVASPIAHNSYTQVSDSRVQVTLVLNKKALVNNFESFKLSHFSVRSCFGGSFFKDIN